MLINLKRRFFKWFFLIVIFILILRNISYAQQIEIIGGPPEGFEDIDKPKITIVDVYYNGRFISAEKAMTTPFSIKFINPNRLFSHLPEINDEYKNIILLRLGISHSSNLHYSCFPVKKSRCGYFNTDNLDVTYNDEFFVAEIILTSNALKDREENKEKYLAPPSDKFSEFFRFNSSIFGNDNKRIEGGNSDTYNIYTNSVTSYKRLFYNFDTFYTKTDKDINFENIFIEKYLNAYNLKAGGFAVQNLRNISQPVLLGFNFDTTTSRRLDLDNARSNEISVFLNYRSRVLIKKDGRIYHSELYDQGFQKLNTSNLPFGSYDIEIETIDPGGISKIETKFFSKQGELPLNDLSFLWFDIGALRELPERDTTFRRFEKKFLSRAGIFKKISPSYGLGGNVLLEKEVSAIETFVETYKTTFKATAGLALTTKTDYAYNFQYQYEKNKWISNLSWRQSFSDSSRYRVNKIYLFRPIASTSKQLSGNINRYILNGRGDIGVFFTHSVSNHQETHSIGPKLRFNLFQNISGLTGTIEVSKFYTDLDDQFSINFLLNYVKGRWQFNGNNRYDYKENTDKSSDNYKNTNETWTTNNTLSWQDGDLWEDDLRLTGRYGVDDGLTTTETEMDYKSNYGRIVANSRNNNRNNDYSIDLTTNFAYSQKAFAMGGKDTRESMLVIKIDGDNKDSTYDIYINGSPEHRIKVGKRKVITLTAFEEYSIYLKPKDGSNTYLESKPKKIVTYPGSMDFLTYEAKNMGVLVGTLYDPSGIKILKNTDVIGQIASATTDQYGFFQIEALLGEELIINNKYIYKVPEKVDESGVFFIDKIIVEKSNFEFKKEKIQNDILLNEKEIKKQIEKEKERIKKAKKRRRDDEKTIQKQRKKAEEIKVKKIKEIEEEQLKLNKEKIKQNNKELKDKEKLEKKQKKQAKKIKRKKNYQLTKGKISEKELKKIKKKEARELKKRLRKN